MAEEGANELTAAEATRQIRAGRLTAEALARACLARIDTREAEVGAWECLDRHGALAAARQLDGAAAGGLLYGIPIAVKDIIDTDAMPTTLGSPIYRGRRALWDAACVAQLRRAGAVVLGKSVTTEFAFFAPGKTRNPHDLRRTPGGSSSGSAAAVADHMVPIGLGTQTAASLTRPASYCGVFGYKGSLGAFSLSGIRPFAESLDSLGIMARSVEDLALTRCVARGDRICLAVVGGAAPTLWVLPHSLLAVGGPQHAGRAGALGRAPEIRWRPGRRGRAAFRIR